MLTAGSAMSGAATQYCCPAGFLCLHVHTLSCWLLSACFQNLPYMFGELLVLPQAADSETVTGVHSCHEDVTLTHAQAAWLRTLELSAWLWQNSVGHACG